MTRRAAFSVGAPLGLLFIALILAVDGWLLAWLINDSLRPQEINFVSYLVGLIVLASLPILVALVYQVVSCLTLRYHLDRNGVVPIRDIQQVVPGHELKNPPVRRRGLRWPGHERGAGMVPGIGRTRFLATRGLAQQLLLVTPGLAFAISPDDLGGFMQGLAVRRELGPNRLLERALHKARPLTWSIWRDETAWVLLGAAVAINLALFGYLSARFPGLDFQLPLHFNNLGQADRIGVKMELFALPIIGIIILGTNLVLGLALYRRERAGSYLLWGAATAAQALFWLATFSIVP
ncbi:MAG: PH domain-containing protein [Anaerolineae bacterium]